MSAVIFDIDGVLVDSHDAHLRAWQVLASETGTAFSEADFLAGFGQTSRDILRRWWHCTDDAVIKRLDDRKEALYREMVSREFPAMDGAVELIDALRAAGFALAMGSSGPPENVRLALERLGRSEAFGAAISGFDVKRGKPDPEIFLLAASRLGVEPARCVVIEDAPAGIQAARAGHMAAVALLGRGRKREDFMKNPPDLFVNSLRELKPPMIARLIDR